jgi:hypothetical protein
LLSLETAAHMSDSQRAMVAARLANMPQGARTDLPSFEGKLSQTDAAKALNVSVASLQRAKAVLDSGDEQLIRQVDARST